MLKSKWAKYYGQDANQFNYTQVNKMISRHYPEPGVSVDKIDNNQKLN